MIPIHYFLALLAILVSLTGCTQKAPPGSRQTLTSNNSTDSVDPEEEPQTLHHGNDPVVKPGVEPAATAIELSQPNGARDWKIVLKGKDAKTLYRIMKIKKSDDGNRAHRELDAEVKTGKHLECYELSDGNYECEIILEGATGELFAHQKIQTWAAAMDLKEIPEADLKDSFMELYSVSTGGKFSLNGDEAQKIFDALTDTKVVRFVTLDPDKDSDGYAEGKQKKGVNVDCYQQFKKAKPAEAIYSCNFWFLNSTTGEFEKIK